jgi:hypothetical protein
VSCGRQGGGVGSGDLELGNGSLNWGMDEVVGVRLRSGEKERRLDRFSDCGKRRLGVDVSRETCRGGSRKRVVAAVGVDVRAGELGQREGDTESDPWRREGLSPVDISLRLTLFLATGRLGQFVLGPLWAAGFGASTWPTTTPLCSGRATSSRTSSRATRVLRPARGVRVARRAQPPAGRAEARAAAGTTDAAGRPTESRDRARRC